MRFWIACSESYWSFLFCEFPACLHWMAPILSALEVPGLSAWKFHELSAWKFNGLSALKFHELSALEI
jgi:hypothetical protein